MKFATPAAPVAVGESPTTRSEMPVEESAPTSFEESAEAVFLAEARERGEVVAPPRAATTESPDETDKGPLPPLADLVSRIPADVRATLDDLFRAKFVAVRRVPVRALKN